MYRKRDHNQLSDITCSIASSSSSYNINILPSFYKFVNFTKLYAYPKPFLSDKKVRTYITHGAPSLPVKTIYLNSVKLRLVLGVFSFVFGWKLSRWLKTKQFWSVPFVTDEKRKKYLKVVKKDIKKEKHFNFENA